MDFKHALQYTTRRDEFGVVCHPLNLQVRDHHPTSRVECVLFCLVVGRVNLFFKHDVGGFFDAVFWHAAVMSDGSSFFFTTIWLKTSLVIVRPGL